MIPTMRLLPAYWIGRTVEVAIDRPIGFTHPKHPELIYQLNYGEIPGTLAADGEPVDAYVLGPTQPLRQFSGVVIAIIQRENDIEDKLVVASPNATYTAQQIAAAVAFQEKWFNSSVITA
jgi:inorganic pyrophosphatase